MAARIQIQIKFAPPYEHTPHKRVSSGVLDNMSVYYAKLPTARSTRVLSFEPLPDIVDPSHAASGHEAAHCDWSVMSVRLMKIMYNLWAAKAVWSKYPSRRLWVDAICINQDDIPERKQQVTMMGNIYSRAERVAIWVGEATAHSDDFFRVVERVQAGGKLSIGECPRPTNDNDRSQGSDRDFMNHLLDCAADIVNRPWLLGLSRKSDSLGKPLSPVALT